MNYTSPQPDVLVRPMERFSGNTEWSPLVCLAGADFCLPLFDLYDVPRFGFGTEKETRKLKNVIRSDGYCRIELLGPHPGGA
jgi:hypothetical protein